MNRIVPALRTRLCKAPLLFAALMIGTTNVSAAVLDGQILEYQYLYTTISSPYAMPANGNKLVGPGIEIPDILSSRGTMDISDTNIYVDFTINGGFSSATFNGFRLTDVFATIPDFSAVTINPATNLVGFDASRITFDADHIWVNWQGLTIDPTRVMSLDISVVPEPSTLALAGLGLFGLVAYGWRRRKQVAAAA